MQHFAGLTRVFVRAKFELVHRIESFIKRGMAAMATAAVSETMEKENTPIVDRSQSQILEDECTKLEVRHRHCPTDA